MSAEDKDYHEIFRKDSRNLQGSERGKKRNNRREVAKREYQKAKRTRK